MQRCNDILEVAVEDGFEVVPGFTDAVISHPVLGIVVGTDFFRAHAGADGGTSRADFSLDFVLFALPEFLAEKFQGNFLVALLVAFGADENDVTTGGIGEANGGGNLVDVLTSRSAGAGEFPDNFGFVDLDIAGGNFG